MHDFGPPSGDRELSAVAAIVAQCFNVPLEECPPFLARGGEHNFRVLRERGEVRACLLIIPMGQWFGGRAVPTGGIAAVGVLPEHRGAGHALAITRAALAEMARTGLCLSTLYPATTQLYRQAGYELAGNRFELRLTPQQIGLRDRALPLRGAAPADLPAIAELARTRGAAGAGQLDRCDYIWLRIREPRGKTVRGYVVERDGRIEGYLFVHQTAASRPSHYDLNVTDWAFSGPAAGRRLLAFLADHASLADSVILHGSPADPLLALLPERTFSARLVDPWMVRVVDAAAALAARGWPVAARGELLLELRDELLPRNNGRFLLEVEGGAARVAPAPRAGGAPALSLDVRGLAPLFTGHMPPRELALAGLVAGSPEALDLAGALFAGPAPVMTDMF